MASALLIFVLVALSLQAWRGIIERWMRGLPALERLPRNPSPWLPIACGAAAVLVALMVSVSVTMLLRDTQTLIDIGLSDVQWSVFDGMLHVLVALALLTGGGRVPLAECGLNTRHFDRQVRDGLWGFAASVLPVMFVLVLTAALRTPDNQHPFLKLLQRDSSVVGVAAWLMVSAVVVAPFKEELLFRVMLQDGLARRIGSTPAIGITAVLFCMVHGFPDALALLPLALILGYVYDRRQSVLSVVLIHALFNLTNILILLLNPEAPV
jgi:uncharacterized protein